MPPFVTAIALILDLAVIIASFYAAWMWYRASHRPIHRVTYDEVFDYHDINRVIVAFNRSGLRNRRAALASAVAAGLLGLDLAFSHLVLGG